MADPGALPDFAADPAALDFSSLRDQGIALIQRLAGETWTDHNTHDPGITILEQLCYGLTDLGYRSAFDLPDLLTRDGEAPYASLYTPAQILPTSPVTIADLRKLVVDVPGVKNAWIDTVDEPIASYDAAHSEMSHLAPNGSGQDASSPSPNISKIRIKGLYRVWIEKSDLLDRDGGVIRADVARRLHRFRGLGEDFQQIKVLDFQPVRLDAALEIGAVSDATALLADVYHRIAKYMSPSVPFHTLDEMLARGRRADEIFEGPLLEHGFIDTDELAKIERRSSLRISDLIHELMSVAGVLAVKNLHFSNADGSPSQDWLLDIPADKVPRFDLQNSDIRLERRGLRIDPGLQPPAEQLYQKLAAQAAIPVASAAQERDLRPQSGRDRKIANYHSIQHQFPMVYGIGDAGLSRSAPPERRAQAKQLQAYLNFFDQLLANHFAQLANFGRLFSFEDETPDSYFFQPVYDDGTLGLDALYAFSADDRLKLLSRITEDPWSDPSQPADAGEVPGLRRRNRFLDHLLARFGEQFRDYALLRADPAADDGATRGDQLARDKRAFLRDYPRIGRDRGTAFDYLDPAGEENISGLERALHRKLGISGPQERFHLVEHVLLRPIAGDANQTGPLFRAALVRDPYSLQISLVFPDWTGRFTDPNFRRFVEQTVRDAAPAHLAVYVLWKNQAEMAAFGSAHAAWLQQWRAHRLAELELSGTAE